MIDLFRLAKRRLQFEQSGPVTGDAGSRTKIGDTDAGSYAYAKARRHTTGSAGCSTNATTSTTQTFAHVGAGQIHASVTTAIVTM